MSYTKEERETIITTDDCMENWNIYTRQRKVMTKLLKLPEFVKKRTEYNEKKVMIELEGTIPFKCVSFRKLRILSEEKKKELGDRLREARENK
jgi:hypothetical protein